MDERFGELRSLAHEAPSAAAWARLQRELFLMGGGDAAGRRFVEEVATSYLAATLASWPDALRIASIEDAHALLREPGQGALVGAASLARSLRLDLVVGHYAGLVGEAREVGQTLTASLMRRLDDALRTITHLTLRSTPGAPLPQRVLASALAIGAHTSGLRSLDLSSAGRHDAPLLPRDVGLLVRSGKLARLRALDVSGCSERGGDALIAALTSGPLDALERLDLSATHQSDASLQALARAPLARQLTWLNIQQNLAIEGAWLGALLGAAPRLNALLLWGVRLEDDGARALASHPLELLDLSGSRREASFMRVFASALDAEHPLRALRLADASLDGEGLIALMRAPLPSLRELVLWGNQDVDALALLPGRAPWWYGIERLWLGAQPDVPALLAQPAPLHLRELRLARAGLRAEEIQRMAVRGWLERVEVFESGRDALGDAALDALAAARWSALRELHLHTSSASAEAWARLLDALEAQGVRLEALAMDGRLSADAALALLADRPLTARLHTLELPGLQEASEAGVATACAPEALPALRVLQLPLGSNPHLRERLRARLDLWQCV